MLEEDQLLRNILLIRSSSKPHFTSSHHEKYTPLPYPRTAGLIDPLCELKTSSYAFYCQVPPINGMDDFVPFPKLDARQLETSVFFLSPRCQDVACVCVRHIIVKLQLNSQLHLHSNPSPSPLQVNSTPPRVELELYLIIGFHHHPPTSPHYFSKQ